ncbi:hypothetical protein AAFC00_005267 [Neodothiora populina]|uniref:Expansin-like EG45 domain-containing protein n=1 Tax=Neodothiora populina TaxID=2781224 RepID=A0ABR3PKB2_9PEZI
MPSFRAIAALAGLATAAFAAVTPEMSLDSRATVRRSLAGEATFYGGNTQGGACSFSTYTIPSGLYGTALSSSNWDNSGNCGGCVAVTYGGKTITAMIVDECPGCGENHLDLFPDAFAEFADKSKGVIDVNWDYVPCASIEAPLQIHMKTGVSQYWFSAQVVGAKRRTAKLEVSTDQGKTWKSTERKDYNFFEISSGVGASTAWIRATSHVGTTVTVKDVSMTADAVATATANYA